MGDLFSLVPYPFHPFSLQVCLEEPNVAQATTDWTSETQWVSGSSVLATCLDSHFFIDTEIQTRTVECVNGNWESVPGCEQGEWWQ